MDRKILSFRNIPRIRPGKKVIKEPDLPRNGMRSRHPVQGSLDLPAVRSPSPSCHRVIGTVESDNLSGIRVAGDPLAFQEIRIPQSDLPSRREAEKFFGRILHEIVALDVNLP